MEKRKIFLVCPIGSSDSPERFRSDRLLREIVNPVVTKLLKRRPEETVVRADMIGEPGRITLQIFRELEFSDVVIADLTGSNANVMYEIGYRQALNLPYILMAEEGQRLPFDLSDFRTIFYALNPEGVKNAQGELRTHLQKALETRSERRDSLSAIQQGYKFDDSQLGISTALDTVVKWVNKSLEILSNDEVELEKPFRFDATWLCIETYAKALNLVNKRFWTTTYISSGFWTKHNSKILSANRNMLKRLKKGEAKRLFLLSREPSDEINRWTEKYIHLKRLGRTKELEELRNSFETLKREVKILISDGCEVKVAFNELEHMNLPDEIKDFFEYGDSEIAIYDRFRVDVFGGGSLGKITNVAIFTEATKYFKEILNKAETYFESIWEDNKNAEAIEQFMSRWEKEYRATANQIYYSSDNWPYEYEFLKGESGHLKRVEMDTVNSRLHQLNRWGSFRRYLDIGTCTGRYPIGLREAVCSDGQIIGIDNDPRCVDLAESNRENQVGKDQRIKILGIDLYDKEVPNLGKFDLITCMLGTLSHLIGTWPSSDRGVQLTPKDKLNTVLQLITHLLSDDGVLILSIWSEHARNTLQMIDIYCEADRKTLARWTPSFTDVKESLEALGLTIHRDDSHLRLILLTCQPKGL